MSIKDVADKVSAETITFLEKSTEMRLFMHLLCITLYIEIALSISLQKSIFEITWSDIEGMTPGHAIAVFVGYFALMGFLFRVFFAVLTWCLLQLHWRLASPFETTWRDIPGMVHRSEIVKRAYASKDYEALHCLDVHQERCRKERKTTGDLAYLSFAILAFTLASKWMMTDGVLDHAQILCSAMLSPKIAEFIAVLMLTPFLMLLWLDVSKDLSRQDYLYHRPIYLEVEQEKRTSGGGGSR